jgi:formylglycine-generating enzyme required for sulfatase activity
VTSRSYGSSEALLGRYAHYRDNSGARAWPVGQKRPNDLGLFDVYGNVWAWCDGPALLYPRGRAADKEYIRDIQYMLDSDGLALRGGSFDYLAAFVRSSVRYSGPPGSRFYNVGLRACRTYQAGPPGPEGPG